MEIGARIKDLVMLKDDLMEVSNRFLKSDLNIKVQKHGAGDDGPSLEIDDWLIVFHCEIKIRTIGGVIKGDGYVLESSVVYSHSPDDVDYIQILETRDRYFLMSKILATILENDIKNYFEYKAYQEWEKDVEEEGRYV